MLQIPSPAVLRMAYGTFAGMRGVDVDDHGTYPGQARDQRRGGMPAESSGREVMPDDESAR
jgi:hypothetical protein